MLGGRSFLRFYSTDVAKSLLGTLRRRSGFPIIKCKEALTKHQNDLEAAETWLQEQAQKEGWAKVAKMQERQAKQGLVGVALDGSRAAMVEVNCETDFVARNEKFQSLVSTITQNTLKYLSPKLLTTTNLASLDVLMSDSIANIVDRESGDGGGSMADRVAEMVGHLQEKMVIARGCTVCCTNGILCAHVYNNRSPPESSVQMGTYGAILHMIGSNSESLIGGADSELKTLGERICQHIIGVNPLSVEEGGGEEGGEGSRVLVNQRFLFDDSVTIGELLQKNGVKVTRFVRYALGEKEDNPWTNS